MSETTPLRTFWALVIGLGCTFLAPLVLRDLWNWFAVPLFAWPLLTYRVAFGLGALKALLTYRYQKPSTDYAEIFSYAWLLLIVWGIGAIAR